MSLGTRQLALSIAALVCTSALTACGDDEPAAPDPDSPSSSSAASETTEPPVETSSTPEATPTVEPATGIKLVHDLAEITMPEGWKREDNFGIPFVRQGGDNLFGILTFSELGGEDKQATSLDAIAKRQLRLVANPRIKRMDDVVLGDGTRAYRLVGRDGPFSYVEYYGVLIGNIEYTLAFDFTTEYGTVKEAKDLMASMLATFDFNP